MQQSIKEIPYRVSGIYLIKNLSNGKMYVGSATSLKRRLQLHLSQLKAGVHHNIKLQRAWDKYGENSFVAEITEVVNKEDISTLTDREQFWMDKLDVVTSGYNICPVAGSSLGRVVTESFRKKCSVRQVGRKYGPEVGEKHRHWNLNHRTYSEEFIDKFKKLRVGTKLSEEHRKKISETLKAKGMSQSHKDAINKSRVGRVMSEETKRKISQAKLGKKMSTESREKMSATRLGVSRGPMSEEQKIKISAANLGKKHTEEGRAKMKKAWAERKGLK